MGRKKTGGAQRRAADPMVGRAKGASAAKTNETGKPSGFSEQPQARLEGIPAGLQLTGSGRHVTAGNIRESLEDARRSLASTSAALEKLSAENTLLRKQVREAKRETARTREIGMKAITSAASVPQDMLPERIGRTVIAHARKPWKLPLLPYDLWKTYRAYRDDRRAGNLQTIGDVKRWFKDATSQSGLKYIELTAADVAQLQNSNELRQVFWPAFRSNQYDLCHAVIERYREVMDTGEPDRYFAKMLEKMPPEYEVLGLTDVEPDSGFQPIRDKVCYALHNSLPYSSGGYATRARGLATALAANGYKMHLVTRPGFPFDYKPELTDEEVPQSETIEGLTYHRILEPKRKKHRIADYLKLSADAFEQKFRELRPSLVIAASNYHTALPALIAARRLGLPFIYEVRGFWEITRISREPEFINHPSYATQEFMEAELCRHADQVFTLTNAMRTELIRRGVAREKIELLPNACNPEKFKPARRSASLAKRYAIPPRVPVIGYIGSFVQYEGLENLAEACGILKARGIEFRLMIVGNEDVSGSGIGPIGTAIRANAEAGNLSDWLIMPGRIPHDEVPTHYSLIDVAVFPRKPQPVTEMVSPIKPLEAMAMGKAILVSSVDAMAEMVKPGETGLVFEKGNILSMADELERLLSDPALRKQLGTNARPWVNAQRSWNKVAQSAIPFLKVAGQENRKRIQGRKK